MLPRGERRHQFGQKVAKPTTEGRLSTAVGRATNHELRHQFGRKVATGGRLLTDTLAQICTAQKGTWSTNHCDPAAWKKKCTQDVFSGVYIQYLPADGICAAGFEEPL